jgi:hypothetical protein
MSEKKGCPDFGIVECLQMAKLLIESFENRNTSDFASLEEDFPVEAERIRESILRLRAFTSAYERGFESPYACGYEPDSRTTWRRHMEGYRR